MSAREQGVEQLALPDMERRTANMVRFGKITAIDYAARRVRVQSGEITTAWLPWAGGRAAAGKRTWDAPEVGEQVIVLSPTGDLRQAGVIPGFYQDAYDAPSSDPNKDKTEYGDGTVVEYDRGTHTLLAQINSTTITANRDMIHLVAGGCSIKISAAGIEIVGPITHTGGNTTSTGNFTTTGNVTGQTDVFGGGKSLKTHVHSGVQPGGGTTGAPV